MEEQVLILIQEALKQPFNEEVCEEIAAKEVTSMVMEFCTWYKYDNTFMQCSINGENKYFEIMVGSFTNQTKYLTFNELFQYWFDNIYNKKP